MIKTKEPERITQCVEKGCNRPPEKDNERCRWHSVKYYAGYWGKESVNALQGGKLVQPEIY